MKLPRSARAALLLLAIGLPTVAPVFAQGAFVLLNERNHPELRWQELQTDHFRIFFHDPLEPWAREAASILERYHGPLCRRLDVIPPRRTRVYVSDQDQIANGMAVGHDYFFVWIPSHASGRSFAGGSSWFQEVLIHEYAHILVAWASKSWLGPLADAAGKSPPRWLHEGIAQWTAETWNVLRGDGTISAAILDEGLARWPKDGRLLYAQGNARVRWLAATFGDTTISRLIRPGGSLHLYDYDAAERRALGKRREGLYRRFRREMIAFYGERYRLGESADSIGARLNTSLASAQRLARGADGVEWWTGQSQSRRAESSLFRKGANGRPMRVVAGGVTGRAVPLPGGRVLVPRWHRAAHGSIVQDLYAWDPSSGSRFLTSGERLVEVDTLSGRRLIAICDAPMGATLAHGPIPSSQGPVAIETLLRWPRGVTPHSIASSGDGKRLLLSAVEPDGRRGLWGFSVGHDSVDTLRFGVSSSEARGCVWLDTLRIAWTSHEGGMSQVRTARWPRGKRIEGDTLRTALGTGAELIGHLGDSLVVVDRTSREVSPVFRLASTRHPRVGSIARPYPFPEGAAVALDDRTPGIRGPFPYRASAQVRSWLQLPLIGPQAGRAGAGWLGFWAEPLLHHLVTGYVYTNRSLASNPDRAILYLTARHGPWLAIHHSSTLFPRRFLEDRLLWERRGQTGIAMLSPLHREADPNLTGWISGFLRTESRIPKLGGRSLHTPLGPPRAWSSLVAGGGAGFAVAPPHGRTSLGIRDGYGLSAQLKKGSSAWKGAADFARGSLDGYVAREIGIPGLPFLWMEGGLRAASSQLPPQEFEGIDADPSWRILPGWPGLDGAVYLRGWPEARASRFVLRGSTEIRFPVLPDLGLRGPGVAIQGGTLAPFLDAAHPWGGPSGTFSRERVRATFGLEARLLSRIGPLQILPAVAWGRSVGRGAPSGSWSFRLTTGSPIAMPLSPPRALRWLMSGQIQDGPAQAMEPVSGKSVPL